MTNKDKLITALVLTVLEHDSDKVAQSEWEAQMFRRTGRKLFLESVQGSKYLAIRRVKARRFKTALGWKKLEKRLLDSGLLEP